MEKLNLVWHWSGILSLFILVIAYGFVFAEGTTHFRKSKPVLMAAFLIWLFIAIAYHGTKQAHLVHDAYSHNFLEYTEILVFLLVAMTFINVLEERGAFEALRSWLIRKGWSLRKLFWATGFLAFWISPIADNMTTALIMGAVVMAVGGKNDKFVVPACINVVVAANAGGAFSPFGDITTLMVWNTKGFEPEVFLHILPAALVTWLVPAFLMSLQISADKPEKINEPLVTMKTGARWVMAIFAGAIAMAVIGHNSFHMPPVYGMLGGLAILKIFGYFLRIRSTENTPFDIFHHVQRLEWDTLLFFGGIILAVGGIGFIGYLEVLSQAGYRAWGPLSTEGAITVANIAVGLLSAIIDNIPLMFAVLSMNPDMSMWQWLLVTLTAGTGGSLLSIGSAAGVAMMGRSRGVYTSARHLRYTPVILLGYVAAIGTHYLYALWFAPQLFTQMPK